jgi:hypothetical protein
MHSATSWRRYPALAVWTAAQARGAPYPWNHPLSHAARYEVVARELDTWADNARAAFSVSTWRTAADETMARSVEILATAERSVRAAPGETARG